jgi:CheY-like chemotaxis protein
VGTINLERSVLIVEDVDDKFRDVTRVIEQLFGHDLVLHRATNLNDAEDMLAQAEWSLLLLDLSMDITETKSVDTSSGHASLGGLDILERMSLLRISIPTILVTGFDSFQDSDRFGNTITHLPDVERLAKDWIDASYIGYVRYGPTRWDKRLRMLLSKWNSKWMS